MIARLIGWIIFLAGVSVLVRDVLVWIDTKRWAPMALGQLWFDLNRSSLNLTQAVVQRYIHSFLWDPIIVTILLCWAFAGDVTAIAFGKHVLPQGLDRFAGDDLAADRGLDGDLKELPRNQILQPL